MKKWGISFLLIALLVAQFPVSSYAIGFFKYGYPPDAVVTPQGPAPMQTLKVKVTGKKEATPMIIWVQTDGPNWKATWEGGSEITDTTGSGVSAVPNKKRTDFILDMSVYAPDLMEDSKHNEFTKSEIKSFGISDMKWISANSYTPAITGEDPEFQVGTLTANIKVYTGYDDEDKLIYNDKPEF
ncbi:hypothetical protein [Paenibacillus etheri]|uniref:Uncharacterized protein n=1 Tax=Paenibacillus etheri TaxID=1306852 RepID=A0A0W1AWS8_9BACL|nr:hypothetical protein [Paenibacillus etheri]KTD85743.1 hypothetical protein UQ64_19875 [Paenibacillus etheri]